jgi:hypothetical protein
MSALGRVPPNLAARGLLEREAAYSFHHAGRKAPPHEHGRLMAERRECRLTDVTPQADVLLCLRRAA